MRIFSRRKDPLEVYFDRNMLKAKYSRLAFYMRQLELTFGIIENSRRFSMFKNIGEKIKTLAIVCTVCGCLLSVIGAIVSWYFEIVWAGFLILIGGCLFSWISTFVLYGFGELISQMTKAAKSIQNMQMLSICQNTDAPDDVKKDVIEDIQNEVIGDYKAEKDEDVDESETINIPNSDECPSCFAKISPDDEECPNCGYKLK